MSETQAENTSASPKAGHRRGAHGSAPISPREASARPADPADSLGARTDTAAPASSMSGMSSAPRRGQREPTPTRHVQTLAAAYSAICSGMPPWVALNEFFHEWFDYSSDQRDRLVADPIPCTRYSARHIRHTQRVSNQTDALDQWRWAVFCVGAADYLCQHFDVPRPAWLDDPRVLLSEPWYGCGDPGATHPDVRAHLEGTTPEPLRRRNVLSGERVFANKYVATHASVPAQRVSPSGQDDAD